MTDESTPGAEWRTVPGLAAYEVSDGGGIRRTDTGRALRADPGPCGFATVRLPDGTGGWCWRRVGSLVALAFLGPQPSASEVRRLNGDPLDDRLSNLAYGSMAEVLADHAARARRVERAGGPTHCPAGHRYADHWLSAYGERFCQECANAGVRARPLTERSRAARRAKDARYRQRNPEKVAAKKRRHYQRHRGEILARQRAAYEPSIRTAACQDCGVELPPKRGVGGVVTRCPDCRLVARREASRRYEASGKRRRQR